MRSPRRSSGNRSASAWRATRRTRPTAGRRRSTRAQAFKDYAAGGLAGVKSQLGTELDSLAGKAAGSGRLNTGFYDLDQGDVVRNVYGDYDRGLQQAALQTTGMQQQNNQNLLNYTADKRNTYLDLLTGNMDRATAQKNAKGGFWKTLGGIGKTLLGTAGSVISPIKLGIGK